MKVTLLILMAMLTPATVRADSVAYNPPKVFVSECSACHIAFAPNLLTAKQWNSTMMNLKNHFDTDASLSADDLKTINAYLQNNAGRDSKVGNSPTPIRITTTDRFIRKHREIPNHFWNDPRVKSKNNCLACHKGAEQYQFNEHDIAIPELAEGGKKKRSWFDND